MTPDAIDLAVFRELQDSAGAEFVVELVDTFFEEAPLMLAELRGARAAADGERFRRAAHSMKSNSHTFGATTLGRLARALELKGLDADPAADEAAISAIEVAYRDAAEMLRELTRG
jgi:HPt (histidine-containing phosphotransfer) domain-containing protein